MIEFAKLPLDERVTYFEETANRLGLTRLIVEKDFWVCFTLRLLFNLEEIKNNIIFKVGTSLSKVFGIIKRFSEDIDISIDPDWLGFGGEKLCRKWKVTNEKTFEKGLKQLRKYVDTAGANEGHLIIFNRNKNVSWDEKIYCNQVDNKITVWGM